MGLFEQRIPFDMMFVAVPSVRMPENVNGRLIITVLHSLKTGLYVNLRKM